MSYYDFENKNKKIGIYSFVGKAKDLLNCEIKLNKHRVNLIYFLHELCGFPIAPSTVSAREYLTYN